MLDAHKHRALHFAHYIPSQSYFVKFDTDYSMCTVRRFTYHFSSRGCGKLSGFDWLKRRLKLKCSLKLMDPLPIRGLEMPLRPCRSARVRGRVKCS